MHGLAFCPSLFLFLSLSFVARGFLGYNSIFQLRDRRYGCVCVCQLLFPRSTTTSVQFHLDPLGFQAVQASRGPEPGGGSPDNEDTPHLGVNVPAHFLSIFKPSDVNKTVRTLSPCRSLSGLFLKPQVAQRSKPVM